MVSVDRPSHQASYDDQLSEIRKQFDFENQAIEDIEEGSQYEPISGQISGQISKQGSALGKLETHLKSLKHLKGSMKGDLKGPLKGLSDLKGFKDEFEVDLWNGSANVSEEKELN